jgi:hypothetical protein
MLEKIRENINNPEELERLYRDDRKSFESGFEKIYSQLDLYKKMFKIYIQRYLHFLQKRF